MRLAAILTCAAMGRAAMADQTLIVTVPALTTTIVEPTYTGQPLVITIPIGVDPNGAPIVITATTTVNNGPAASAAFATGVSLYSQSVASVLASISSVESAAAALGTARTTSVVVGGNTIAVPVPIAQTTSTYPAADTSITTVSVASSSIGSLSTTSLTSASSSTTSATTMITTKASSSSSSSSTSATTSASSSSVAPVPPVGGASSSTPSFSINALILLVCTIAALV